MTDVKLSEKIAKIAQEIEKLNIVELAELTKYLEDKFGVSTMPVATVPTVQAAPAEEKTTFTVVLTAAGVNKLGVIKAVREILPSLGLMDAKKLVESAPKELLNSVKKDQAEEAKKKVETAGGKVELK